jgi:hypothetical protein
MSKSQKKQKKSGNFLLMFSILLIVAASVYFVVTKPDSKDTYRIKSAGGEDGYRASFINLTGKEAKDKKIKLSDDFWSGGKFK